ncbi:MAG: polysaccharide deacetylase family protein [Desulfovibrio sp.]|nr:polysaccharide deacetylase family protein [Desulfovibrio sp.]
MSAAVRSWAFFCLRLTGGLFLCVSLAAGGLPLFAEEAAGRNGPGADAQLLAAPGGEQPQADSWAADARDARRALPNDPSPPDVRQPKVMLPPLPEDAAGVIRRVELPHGEKAVALTFDLCELATSTNGCDMGILGFLRERRIPATLFMGGKWMRTHERRVRQILAEPLFEVANHAWTHGNCALLSPEGLKAQVLWTQAQYGILREGLPPALRDAAPPVPTLFRLPYGRATEAALRGINALGLRVVLWDVVAEMGDSTRPGAARRNAAAVAAQVRPGSILLLHANLVPKGSAALVRELVPLLQERGYAFVTVGKLLSMGTAHPCMDGAYFTRPGDNLSLDRKFGIDGTGLKVPFTGR